MKKIFYSVLLLIAVSGYAYSQDLKAIGTTEELKQVFESNKGKVVLVNFWATWCKPCVSEFPELLKLYANYKDKGFALVFLSLDDLSEVDTKLKPFLKKNNVDFTTYYNTFQKPEELIDYIDKSWVGAIPSTYIYDKEGNLKSSILGSKSYEQFETEITKYLE